MSDNRIFVVVDGPDFGGKSTLMKAFLAEVEARGIDHVAMREPGCFPGSDSLAEELRQVLIRNRDNEKVHPEADVMLHMAYRTQNVKNVIIPALNEGKWVISDRFLFSTYCLNVQANLPTHPHLNDLFFGLMPYAAAGIPEPLTFILDTPRAIRDERAALAGDKKDRYESQAPDVHDRIEAAYEHLRSSPSCKFIDGTLPLETQVAVMFETIQSFQENVLEIQKQQAARTEAMAEDKQAAQEQAVDLKTELDADTEWDLEAQVAAYVKTNVTEMADQLFDGTPPEDLVEVLAKAEVFAAEMARTVFHRTNGDRTVFHPSRVGQINQKVHSMLSWGHARDQWTKYFANGGDAAHQQKEAGETEAAE